MWRVNVNVNLEAADLFGPIKNLNPFCFPSQKYEVLMPMIGLMLVYKEQNCLAPSQKILLPTLPLTLEWKWI